MAAAVVGSVKCGRASMYICINIAWGGRDSLSCGILSRNALLTTVCPVFLLPHSVTLNAALGDATQVSEIVGYLRRNFARRSLVSRNKFARSLHIAFAIISKLSNLDYRLYIYIYITFTFNYMFFASFSKSFGTSAILIYILTSFTLLRIKLCFLLISKNWHLYLAEKILAIFIRKMSFAYSDLTTT